MSGGNHPLSRGEPMVCWSFAEGGALAGTRAVPVEMPVNILYGPMPYAVMMATPDDLEDFAIGFSVTEGVARSPADIRGVAIESEAGAVRLRVALVPERMQAHLARARNLSGRTGCGVCGIADLESVPRTDRVVEAAEPLSLAAVRDALAALRDRQPLNASTHAVHAAAWCDAKGTVLAVREDVGRHNALDKLIGALLRAGVAPSSGFVLITSRCSFEMVEKAAVFGAPAVVAISAPTALAIDRARQHGMTLLAIARADGVVCFAEGGGVRNDLSA